MNQETIEKYLEMARDGVITYLPKIAIGLLILWLGFKIIRRLTRITVKSLERVGISENLIPFIRSLMSITLKVLLLFVVAGILGVDLSAFIGILAAAGFAIGLALQGSLSNFAAGILILVFRPYRIDDWIEVDDKFGKVEEIQIFNTIIVTPGRKTLIIPNGQVVEGIVTNYSRKGCIRLELNVTMPYEESFPRVADILHKVLRATPKVLEAPEPEVGIETYDSHSIILAVRPYVNPDDYWEVTFDVHRRIKEAFSENDIRVAYSEGVEIGPIGS
mgnify:CR=1 FL=1